MYILRLVLGLWPLLLAGCTSSSPTSSFATLDDCKFGERPMVVQNNSSQDIWVGITSGSQTCASNSDCAAGETCTPASGTKLNPAHANSGSSCSCNSGQCAPGATCGESSNPKICYLNQPRIYSQIKSPNGDASTKLPSKSSLALCVPKVIDPKVNPVQWSGTIFARTGCDGNGQNCQSANCPTNREGDGCRVDRGGVAPLTVAEFTLQNPASQNLTDYYDVSMIDGVNLAVSIVAGIPKSQPKATLGKTDSPYRCGSPGLACPWKVTPPTGNTVLFQQAGLAGGATGTTCTSNTDCTKSGEICGLALLSNGKAKFGNVCGPLLGYWSGSQICSNTAHLLNGLPAGPIDALKCTTQVLGQLVSDLFGCVGTTGAAASCYTSGSTNTCCGCPTHSGSSAKWPAILSGPATSINSAVCSGDNSGWESNVVPYIQFLKTACPTAYAFPYDDPTSTFQCNSSGSGDSNMTPGYTITFSDLGK